ncbi:MAG TPA: hypothetical protein VFF13_05745 [archaeon]|nr:hypothetical protein [archaeon]
MAIDFTLTSIFNVAAIIIIGISAIFGAKAIKKLYSDEFAATINWILIIIEAVFAIQLIIFLTFYFSIDPQVSTIFVLISTLFVAMLLFFGTYKTIQFLQTYAFEKGELSQQSIERLMKKKTEKKK